MHDDLDLNLEPSEPAVPDVDQGGVSLPQGQVDHEGAMAKADLYKLANYSLKLFKKIQDGDQLEGWVQAKITKAADYIASVYHYLEYEMQFSEYGKKLDNSDVLSESQKAALKNKLMEARSAIKQLKLTQAEKQFGQVDEGILSGGEQSCPECGGSGVVTVAPRAVPEELKNKVKSYNRKAKAYAAATKRIDANKNGIPDDEEMEESSGDEPAAPDSEAIAKKKAREAAARRREEKADADADDLSKDYTPKGEKSSGSRKVGGKAYGGEKQKDTEVEEGQGGIYGQGVYEGKGKSKKAKKDYDKDGKIESEKDEVIGSRRKAAGLDESRDEDEDDYEPYGGEDDPDDFKPKKRPSPAWHKGPSTPSKVKEASDEKRAPAKKTTRTVDLPSGKKGTVTKVQGWQSQKAEKAAEKEKGLDEATGDYSAKKGAAGKDLGKPGKNFAKIAKKAEKGGAKSGEAVAGAVLKKLRAKNEDQSAPLNPQQAAALAKSSDPNAYNKLKGIPVPKNPTPVVSPDEGPTKTSKPVVVKENAELDRMKEFLTRLNG